MRSPREIVQSKQLLVEGLDAERFFEVLLRREAVADVQVQNFGGGDELRRFLPAFKIAPRFDEKVTTLAIVRDAEDNHEAAFQSVCGTLKGANLPVPMCGGEFVGSKPRVAVFILPGFNRIGMLDTLCLESVLDDPAMHCVENYVECVERVSGRRLANPTKSRLYAFLASRTRPNLRLGEAADAGEFRLDSQAFAPLREFIHAL